MNNNRKKENFLLYFSIIIFVFVSFTIIYITKDTINERKLLQKKDIVSTSDKIKVLKSENSKYISYIINDYERNLSYEWNFDKNEITDDLKIDENLNLRLSVDSFNESNEAINERVKQEKLVVTFDYHGKLPASATVKVKVDGKFKDGKKLYLYYYNEEKDQFEYIDNDIKVKDSYAEFTISHCSNYFLTGTIVQDAVNNPKNINYIIIGMIVVVLVLVAATLKQSKK